jgi:hypothetical protein
MFFFFCFTERPDKTNFLHFLHALLLFIYVKYRRVCIYVHPEFHCRHLTCINQPSLTFARTQDRFYSDFIDLLTSIIASESYTFLLVICILRLFCCRLF